MNVFSHGGDLKSLAEEGCAMLFAGTAMELLGASVTTKDGEFYAHLHMCAGNEQGQAFGGHLNEAVISATCELTVTCLPGRTDRAFSDKVGLNLISF